MITYRQQRKDWKAEWKKEKRKKNMQGDQIIPFRDWINGKIPELAKNNPEGFKEYCESFEHYQKVKCGIILGAAAVVGVICLGAVFDMALYYGLTSVEVSSAAVMFGGIAAATGVGAWFARRKYSALQKLKRLFRRTDKDRKRERNYSFDEKLAKEAEMDLKKSRFRKLARLPKVMLDYFESGKVEETNKIDKEPANIEQAPKEESLPPQKETKEIERKIEEEKVVKPIRKEWYSEELEKADKIKVSVYGNKKTDRPDKWGLLGVFDADNIKDALDATNIQNTLGGCPKSVVESINPELLIGARVNDDDKMIRSDSSYTYVNKDEISKAESKEIHEL
ncbi:MAG: phage holin family protein [Clostridia bacterium]|nr:phage holin family protein [Clostridia bacterium]